MKILILSRGRTRSSYLQTKLCHTYNLKDYGERFNKNSYAYSSSLHLKYHNSSLDIADLQWNYFCKLTTEIVDSFFKTDNFAAKLWPRMLTSFPQQIVGDIESYNPKILTNITDYYRITSYDKIYFLDRDITDSVCSWIYAKIINNFLFHNIANVKIERQIQDMKPVLISEDYIPTINFYIYEIALQHRMLDYLYKKEINFIKLDYNDVPNYCASTLSGVDVYKHQNFNYSNLITNYSDIQNHCLSTYKIATNLVSNINFT